MLRLLRQISLRQLRESSGRTALVVGGIATGVALIVAIDLVNESILTGFQSTIARIAGPADLQVTLGIGETGFAEETLDDVRGVSQVAAAVPLVRGTVALAAAPTETLQLFGSELTAEEELQRYRIKLATDRRNASEALLDLDSIFLTKSFAAKYELGVRDTLALLTPIGIVRVTVRGLLEPEGWALAYGGNLAVMDIVGAQRLLAKEGRLDQIDIVVAPKAEVAQVQNRLAAALSDNFSVIRPAEHGMQYEGVLSSFRAMLTGLSMLCLVAGLFIVYNASSTAALRRSTAMGRLRVLGAEERKLFLLLLLEAAIEGLAGSLIGIMIGVPLAWLLSGTVTSGMGVIFQLRFPVEGIAVDVPRLIVIGGLGVLVALAASYFPARRMSLIDPLDSLRSDVRAITPGPRPAKLIAWWLVLLTASIAAFVLEMRLKSIAWGNFGSTLWFASSIVIAIPVVVWLARPLTRALPRVFGAEGRIAAESLARAQTRTGVTVAAIALVMTIAITMACLVHSCRESLRSYFAGFLSSDLTVAAASTEGGWLETPLPAELASELAEVAGVRSVETGRIVVGQLYRDQRVGLLGLSGGFFDSERTPDGWYREGDPQTAARSLRDGTGALVSTSFSDRFDVHLGHLVRLDSATGPVTLPIVGVVPDYISDRGSVIFNRKLLIERWGDASVNRFLLFLQPRVSTDLVRQRIQEKLGERYVLKVLSLKELLAYHTDMINRAFAVTDSFQLLIIFVTIAGIFDLLVSRILERRRELALWRVIGADEAAVRRSVVLESATVGGLGAVFGVVLGIITSWTWIGIHFRHLLGYYIDYHFASIPTVWYVILTMLMTVLAGYAAAFQATRQSVLDGIQME